MRFEITQPACLVALITVVSLFIPPSQSNGQTTFGQPIVLFDGQSTEGWTKANGQPHDGWVVQDGALHRKSGGGDLYHRDTFRDFVLHFQWKISEAGNSGVKYRVKKYGNARLGCEYQILDDLGNKKERNKSASLYDVYDPVAHKPIVQADVWQFSKIVVCKNHIEHWLNGVLVVQTEVGSPEWLASVADSKFRDRDRFGQNREGRIFLQDHGNPVWYRQIVLVPLNCDGPSSVSAPFVIHPQPAAPRFDGWERSESVSQVQSGCECRFTRPSFEPLPSATSGFGWPQSCPPRQFERRSPALFLRRR